MPLKFARPRSRPILARYHTFWPHPFSAARHGTVREMTQLRRLTRLTAVRPRQSIGGSRKGRSKQTGHSEALNRTTLSANPRIRSAESHSHELASVSELCINLITLN